jgi:hypothetical protein
MIKHHSQGIDIRPVIVVLPVVYLRRHIIEGSLDGHRHRVTFHPPCDSKIPQLIIPVYGTKNIPRFDITMNDILIMTNPKSLTDIHSQFSNLNIIPNEGRIIHGNSPDIT